MENASRTQISSDCLEHEEQTPLLRHKEEERQTFKDSDSIANSSRPLKTVVAKDIPSTIKPGSIDVDLHVDVGHNFHMSDTAEGQENNISGRCREHKPVDLKEEKEKKRKKSKSLFRK